MTAPDHAAATQDSTVSPLREGADNLIQARAPYVSQANRLTKPVAAPPGEQNSLRHTQPLFVSCAPCRFAPYHGAFPPRKKRDYVALA